MARLCALGKGPEGEIGEPGLAQAAKVPDRERPLRQVQVAVARLVEEPKDRLGEPILLHTRVIEELVDAQRAFCLKVSTHAI